MADFPILGLLLALPFAGAAGCLLLARKDGARGLALAAAAATLLAALVAVALFDPARGDFQLVEKRLWIPGIGVHYHVGVDGLSLFFLPATALLFAAAMLAGARAPRPAPGLYYGLLLALEGATLGVFCALDTLLFFVFWELTLLPLYFLIGLWGLDAAGRAAAARYFLIMLAGGVPLLFALLLVGAHGGGFDLPALLAADPTALPYGVQLAVLLLFLVGFGVKVPFVPLHTWLPSLALGAPATVTALLVGLKLGAYGLLRLALPLSPLAVRDLHWLLAGLGTVAILYGAVAALAQSNLRGVLAYGGVSHAGLAVLGLASFSVAGAQGAVLLMLTLTLATGGGFLLLGGLQRRLGTCDLAALSGLRQRLPRLAGCFLLFGLAGIGLPGTIGFPAEFLIIVAALPEHAGAALAALFGMVVGAAAFLAPYRAAFFGPLRAGPAAEADDLTQRELAAALVFAALIVGFGLWPAGLLETIRPAAEAWAARLS